MTTGTQISSVNLYTAVSKQSRQISDATHNISEIRFFILEIISQAGIIGQGYLLSFHYSPQTIRGVLQDICPILESLHIYETGRLEALWNEENEYFGQEGAARWALACANIAMWDAWGKTLGTPISKLLGQCTDKIPVYGSGGWLSYSDEELCEEVLSYKKRGFRAVKIKVGSKEIENDIRRLHLVRENLGSKMKIMMDANQGMSLANAFTLSQKVRHLDIHWFEEPIHHANYQGYRYLREKGTLSLAMGEREYSTQALRALIENGGIDLWQPDIIRIGGVEAWKRSVALAHEYQISVLPHYYKDYDVPLLATIPNAYGAESFDWVDDIIDSPMQIENGLAHLRDAPGWGFSFRKEYLEGLS